MPDIRPVPKQFAADLEVHQFLQDIRDKLNSPWTYQQPYKAGDRYLWFDSTGDFRVHTSAPTSDTAGTIIGTQS